MGAIASAPGGPVSLHVDTFVRGLGRVSVPAASPMAVFRAFETIAAEMRGKAPDDEQPASPNEEPGWNPIAILGGLKGLKVAAEALRNLAADSSVSIAVVAEGGAKPEVLAIAMLGVRQTQRVLVTSGRDLVARWRQIYPKVEPPEQPPTM